MRDKFKREDLRYTYDWTLGYREKRPTDLQEYIDRKNGHQMLSFFNEFLEMHGLFSLSSLHRLEKLFCKYMPNDINTRSEIKSWLGKNWNMYFH
jgi:hypothetical protein